MKKLFAGFLIAALLLGIASCAALKAVCSPNATQQQTAQNIENFIASGVVAIVPLVVKDDQGNSVTVQPSDVTKDMNTIIADGCVIINDLVAILNWYQQITHPASGAGMVAAGGGGATPAPDPTPLWAWMGKVNPYAAP
jgi:hypothetical protein